MVEGGGVEGWAQQLLQRECQRAAQSRAQARLSRQQSQRLLVFARSCKSWTVLKFRAQLSVCQRTTPPELPPVFTSNRIGNELFLVFTIAGVCVCVWITAKPRTGNVKGEYVHDLLVKLNIR